LRPSINSWIALDYNEEIEEEKYMLSITKALSYNAKTALIKGIIVGGFAALIYLIIVTVTTPSLPPIAAINAAFKINSLIIFGIAVGVGIQIFISSYSKDMSCKIDKKNKKAIFGAGSGSTAVSSFFSFFSLVPLGCCGSWLLILSFLPSIFGSTISVVLIQYSRLLSYVGLALVFGIAALSAINLSRELKQSKGQGTKNTNDIMYNDQQFKESSHYKEDQI
jgi:hypothetical protein